MIENFKDPMLLYSRIKVQMIDQRGNEEMGVDDGGVLRDCISIFWLQFYDSCTLGENFCVPARIPGYEKMEWLSIGRILLTGYQEFKYWPVRLCPAFVLHIFFEEENIPVDFLVESLYGYLSRDERKALQAYREAISQHQVIQEEKLEELAEEVIEVFGAYECRKVPSPSNFTQLVKEIAHSELIQRPKYIRDQWKEVVTPLKELLDFSSVQNFDKFFTSIQPTSKKVARCIRAEPKTEAESTTLKYLKKFIGGLDDQPQMLRHFLRFVTGADCLCIDGIEVTFSQGQRLPVAHTCGCVLELPTTYSTYPEFRAQLNSILSAGDWSMDFI